MVFQKDTLLPWLTVDGNVRVFYTLNRERRDEAEPLVSDLIELAGLGDFRDAYPYQLSGGMRRRTAFITAMAAQPRLLLLDEPFSSLDEPTRVAIHQDVLDIIKRLHTTVVLVTHDLAEAASLCDRVLVLRHRPGAVAASHEIPFGDERLVLELRQQPSFLELYGELWHDLSLQIERGKGDG
jgi:ABC-type nitrate/sulfonate/bicarbonate transport system ATPase subunit